MNSLSLSLNDTTTAHNTLDTQIADWPEEVRTKAPTRDSHPDPDVRLAALQELKPMALRVKAIGDERAANEARTRAVNEAARLNGQYALEWREANGVQHQEWRALGITTEREYQIYCAQGSEGLRRLADQKTAKLESGYSTF